MSRAWVLIVLVLVLALGTAARGEDRLVAVHERLFEIFFPLEGLEPDLRAAALDVRAAMLGELRADPALGGLVAGLPEAVLTPEGFRAWQTSPDAASATRLRMLYVTRVYGALGRRMAGLPPWAEAPTRPHGWRHPASRLHLVHGRVLHRDGPVDWVIVGSGPAGAVLAHELSRAGHRVVLVDQGPLVPDPRVDTRELPRLKDHGGARPTADGLVLVRTARAVGGGSTVNIDLAFSPELPMVRRRLEEWRRAGRLDPEWFSDAAVREAYRWVVATIGTRTPALAEVNANNRLLLEGCAGAQLYDLNTSSDGTKRGAVERLILPAVERYGLHVVPDAAVTQVVVEGGRARGVEIEARAPWPASFVAADPAGLGLAPGQEVFVPARNVLVCAGAQGTGLLVPGAGTGMVLHPAMPLAGVFDRPIDILEGTPSTVYAEGPEGILFEATAADPQYLALMVPQAGRTLQDLVRRFRHLGGFGVLLVDASRPENRVEPGPRLVWSLSEEDRRRFAAGVAEGIRVLFRAGARQVLVPTSEDVLGDGSPALLSHPSQADLVERRLQFLPGRTLLTSAHMQATCPLGGEILTPRGQVRGVANLWVMDASVFPGSVGANPMQTLYTFAKILADRLR